MAEMTEPTIDEVPPCPFDDLPVKWHVPADYEEAIEMLRRARRDINKYQTIDAQPVPVHVEGKWCADLLCNKCYSADTWQKSALQRAQDKAEEFMELYAKEAAQHFDTKQRAETAEAELFTRTESLNEVNRLLSLHVARVTELEASDLATKLTMKGLATLLENAEALAEQRGKDAERYRWLRLASVDADISNKFVTVCESEPETPELFDAAIDSARAE